MRILVVEDEPRILDDIVTTMGMAGYVVETVTDGERKPGSSAIRKPMT